MMFSGQSEDQIIKTSLDSGANKFMVKPAPIADIQALI